jgi:hypothetical protein
MNVAFADGSVRTLSENVSGANWWTLVTPGLGDKPDSKYAQQ